MGDGRKDWEQSPKVNLSLPLLCSKSALFLPSHIHNCCLTYPVSFEVLWKPIIYEQQLFWVHIEHLNASHVPQQSQNPFTPFVNVIRAIQFNPIPFPALIEHHFSNETELERNTIPCTSQRLTDGRKKREKNKLTENLLRFLSNHGLMMVA